MSAKPVEKKLIDEAVEAFLRWPLPKSVCSDPCASMPGSPHRIGTNLLSAIEAQAMFTEVMLPILRAHDAAILAELRPVEKYVQTLKNGVPIGVVLSTVRACALVGHEKYPVEALAEREKGAGKP